jgi:denticleless
MNLIYFRCASEVGKIATSSDDSTVSLLVMAEHFFLSKCESEHLTILDPMYQVRVWSIKKMDCTNVSSPTVIRKRVTAPNTEHRRSITHEPAATTSRGAVACASGDGEQQSGCHSPLQPRALDFGTPESSKKRERALALFQEEALGARKSPDPEAQMTSPSSVLSPPPSLKRRTIRDYFAASTVS